MASTLLDTKFSVPIKFSEYVGTNLVVLQVLNTDNPFSIVDFNNSTNVSDRTLTGLTAVVSKEYPVSNRLKTGVRYTTTATTQRIAWTQSFNLTDDFFNSNDTPIFVFRFYCVSGAVTATQAQRTVTLKATSGASEIYGPTSVTPTVTVPEMSFEIGEGTGNVDLTGFDEAIVIPLKALVGATNKNFTFELNFNLPSGAVFMGYEADLYRTPEDCDFIRPRTIVHSIPGEIEDAPEPNVGEIKGTLNEHQGDKNRVANFNFTYTPNNYKEEDERILSGEAKYSGGKSISKTVTLTIPDTPYEVSNQVPTLNKVVDKDDIIVELVRPTGEVISAGSTEGDYVTKDRFRFIKGTTNKIRFSPENVGEKAKVVTFYEDPDAVRVSKLALSKTIYCKVWRVYSDTTNLNGSRRVKVEYYGDCQVMVTPKRTDVSTDEKDNMTVNLKTLNRSALDTMCETYYMDVN